MSFITAIRKNNEVVKLQLHGLTPTERRLINQFIYNKGGEPVNFAPNEFLLQALRSALPSCQLTEPVANWYKYALSAQRQDLRGELGTLYYSLRPDVPKDVIIAPDYFQGKTYSYEQYHQLLEPIKAQAVTILKPEAFPYLAQYCKCESVFTRFYNSPGATDAKLFFQQLNYLNPVAFPSYRAFDAMLNEVSLRDIILAYSSTEPDLVVEQDFINIATERVLDTLSNLLDYVLTGSAKPVWIIAPTFQLSYLDRLMRSVVKEGYSRVRYSKDGSEGIEATPFVIHLDSELAAPKGTEHTWYISTYSEEGELI